VLAPIVGVGVPGGRNHLRRKPKIFRRGSFQTFLRGFVIEQPIAFRDMQSLTIRTYAVDVSAILRL
jgi:hypothetical protein